MLRCTCERCPGGKTFGQVIDYLTEHQGVDTTRLRESDVELLAPPAEEIESPLVFTGEADNEGGGFPLQVLVRVFMDDGIAEVSYRHNSRQTWGPPTVTYEELAVVKQIASSKARHPSVKS